FLCPKGREGSSPSSRTQLWVIPHPDRVGDPTSSDGVDDDDALSRRCSQAPPAMSRSAQRGRKVPSLPSNGWTPPPERIRDPRSTLPAQPADPAVGWSPPPPSCWLPAWRRAPSSRTRR